MDGGWTLECRFGLACGCRFRRGSVVSRRRVLFGSVTIFVWYVVCVDRAGCAAARRARLHCKYKFSIRDILFCFYRIRFQILIARV